MDPVIFTLEKQSSIRITFKKVELFMLTVVLTLASHDWDEPLAKCILAIINGCKEKENILISEVMYIYLVHILTEYKHVNTIDNSGKYHYIECLKNKIIFYWVTNDQ